MDTAISGHFRELLGLLGGQVRDYHAIHAGGGGIVKESFEAVPEEGVVVAHEYQRGFDSATSGGS